jgi:hypothetical protein
MHMTHRALRIGLMILSSSAPIFAAEPANEAAKVNADAPRSPLPNVGQIRLLEGQEEYSNAVTARDNADLMRAAWEKANGRRAGQAAPPPNDAEFEKVVAAYKQAIDSYPGTEIEHQCRIRLAGAYQFRGKFDKTIEEAKKDAERFVGTKFGAEATQTVALTYLQALHDPVQAQVWFQKLQIESARFNDENERAKWQAAAREGLERCAAEQGKK